MTGDIERAEDYKIIKNHDLKKKNGPRWNKNLTKSLRLIILQW